MNRSLLVIITFCLSMAQACLTTSARADSKTPVDISSVNNRLDLQPFMEIMVDNSAQLSIDEVSSDIYDDRFEAATTTGNSFGYSEAAYWVRFTLRHDQQTPAPAVLQLEYPLFDDVRFYLPDENGDYTHQHTGDGIDFSAREIKHRSFLFKIPVQPDSTQTYYLRLVTQGSIVISMKLWTYDALIKYVDESGFVFGGYYGIMLILMIAALASFIKIRDRLFLYYAMYLASFLLFQLSLNGFSFQHLWPNSPWFTSKATALFIGTTVITAIVFSGSFLQIWGNKHPRIKRLFQFVLAMGSLSVLVSLFADYAFAVKFSTGSGMLLPPVVILAAIVSYRRNYQPARYFLAAWGIFLSGTFVAGLLFFGFVPHTFFTLYSIQIGSVLEVILLGYALMDRIDILRKEKEDAITKANEYLNRLNTGLETLVDETTSELEMSEAHLKTLVETMPDLVWLKDPDGVFLTVNNKIERLFGTPKENIIGKTDYDFVDRELADHFRKHDKYAITTGEAVVNEEEVTYADDGHTELLETVKIPLHSPEGDLIGVLGIGRDITERRDTEEALRRSQKMEAVGQLSGGIAHDFNNILNIILGSTSLLKKRIDNDDRSLQYINNINISAQRAADLTRQLLGFSRKEVGTIEATNINASINEIDSLIARSITPDIIVEYDFAEDLWQTRINHGDFQDALINLIINARDAMPEGGKLTITTSNTTLDSEYCSRHIDTTPGDYVKLSVRDTGCGMPDEIKEHIFEPFFTTKEPGQGTGLGLAMVFGFVKRSASHINVKTHPGEGTTFTIHLPRLQQQADSGHETVSSSEEVPCGSETLLIVDDEAILRDVAEAFLMELGYTVYLAENGEQALQMLTQQPDIQLMITDISMPGMNGYDLAMKVQDMYPEIKTLFTSGHTSNATIYKRVQEENLAFLRKPYDQDQLARQVRSLLDTEDTPGHDNSQIM